MTNRCPTRIKIIEAAIALIILVGASIFLWHIITRPVRRIPQFFPEFPLFPIHGVGIPTQDTDPNNWPYYDIPFLTWNSDYCHRAVFFPLIWRKGAPPNNCKDGRAVLLFNEPEYAAQSNITPQEAAVVARQYDNWGGRVYCCGNLWLDTGWHWMQQFIVEMGDDIDIIDGLHMHAYSATGRSQIFSATADRWRLLADQEKWDIIVSEWAVSDGTTKEYEEFRDFLVKSLRPTYMFIFSWRYSQIPQMDLADQNGDLTEIGQWWFLMKDGIRHGAYLPYVSVN